MARIRLDFEIKESFEWQVFGLCRYVNSENYS